MQHTDDDWSPPPGVAGEPPDPGLWAPNPEEFPAPPGVIERLASRLAVAQNTLDWADRKWRSRLLKEKWGRLLAKVLRYACFPQRILRPALRQVRETVQFLGWQVAIARCWREEALAVVTDLLFRQALLEDGGPHSSAETPSSQQRRRPHRGNAPPSPRTPTASDGRP